MTTGDAAPPPTAHDYLGFVVDRYPLESNADSGVLWCSCGCIFLDGSDGYLDRFLSAGHAADVHDGQYGIRGDDTECHCHRIPRHIDPAAPLTGAPLFVDAAVGGAPEVDPPDGSHPDGAACDLCGNRAVMWLPPPPYDDWPLTEQQHPNSRRGALVQWLCFDCAGLPDTSPADCVAQRDTWQVLLANDRPTRP